MENAIIVDIDGTVAQKHPDRDIYDYSKVHMDLPIKHVIEIIYKISCSGWVESTCGCGDTTIDPLAKLIFVSGRMDNCKKETERWLGLYIKGYENIGVKVYRKNNFTDCDIDFELYMRKENDFRDDTIIKREIYEEHIKGKYHVLGVFDDRPKVLRMWRELGLVTFNVQQGDNEF